MAEDAPASGSLVADSVKAFAALLVGCSLKEAGDYLGDWIRFKRLGNQVKILEKTKVLLNAHGLKPKAVNLKVLVPLLEAGGLEEDVSIQELWANLLTNAAYADWRVALHLVCIEFLKSVSQIEAKLLAEIHSQAYRKGNSNRSGWLRFDSLSSEWAEKHEYASVGDQSLTGDSPIDYENLSRVLGVDMASIQFAADNLARFNLIYFVSKGTRKHDEPYRGKKERLVKYTYLGKQVSREVLTVNTTAKK